MPPRRPASPEFLAFDHVTLGQDGRRAFRSFHWTWLGGQQWAVLGDDNSGKSLLVEALLGHVPVLRGEIRGPQAAPGRTSGPAPAIALVSPRTQQDVAREEGAFYQQRWHRGLEHAPRTVAAWLSRESVEERNPFEVDPPRGNPAAFRSRRRRILDWLGLRPLLRRRLVHLSNGELRKVLLARALLQSPALLVLDDPYAGLDASTRRQLRTVILRLQRGGQPVLVVTSRPEDLPARTTHVLWVDGSRVVGQGPRRVVVRRIRESAARSLRPPASTARAPARPPGAAGRPLVELRRVSVRGSGRHLLRDVTWTLRARERWALLGHNGAGKTTLLNLLQGDHPQAYAVDLRLFGRRTDSTRALWLARQRMGWMSPELHLHHPGECAVLDVVCSGHFNSIGLHQACTRRQVAAARHWLRVLGLEACADTPLGELSHGRQRLVLLARAAVKRPALLILDEPCQGLDASQRAVLLDAVDAVVSRTEASLIFVSHRDDERPRCLTHALRLVRGRITRSGPL